MRTDLQKQRSVVRPGNAVSGGGGRFFIRSSFPVAADRRFGGRIDRRRSRGEYVDRKALRGRFFLLCGRCMSSLLLQAAGAIDAFYRPVGDFNVWPTVWRIVGLAGRPR
ncbi:hypothetical protein [Burkholderia multivorans]|uniref:hypothetical protein n=1 Tax=Burkholderia multivorans TaxID=87883 RepID=UPI0021C0003F|nr:hypothetical protein [Burkholderia multivorans]